MRVIVTGGAGFIGGHLVERLVANGHNVLVIDNLSRGRIEHVPPEADLLEVDLGLIDGDLLERHVREFEPTSIVHLAAIHFIPYCETHPEETFRSNVRSTELIGRLASQSASCRRLVSTSSMAIYGIQDRVHQEKDMPEPIDIYGMTKVLLEQITAFAIRRSDQLSGACLRLANVYGPRETNPHLIPDTLDRFLDKSVASISMGNLKPQRDFIHVFDVVDAILKVLHHPGDGFSVFNVGTGIPTSARRVVQLLADATGESRPIVEDPARFRESDRPTLTPDISRMEKEMKWHPEFSLERGLAELAEEWTRASRES